MPALWPQALFPTVTEDKQQESLDKCWDDFNHLESQVLGLSEQFTDRRSTAYIIYERRTFQPHVLQSCLREEFSIYRCALAEMARTNDLFVRTNFVFSYRGLCHVGSQLVDICLADIINCDIPLTDGHIAAILLQVARALYATSRQSIVYHNLKASNVYVSRSGTVHLGKFDPVQGGPANRTANFTHGLHPRFLENVFDNPDCQGLGNLAIHLRTRRAPDVLQNARETADIRTGMHTNVVNVASNSYSPLLLDFISKCKPPHGCLRGSILECIEVSLLPRSRVRADDSMISTNSCKPVTEPRSFHS
jgi:serine/threonine protein kinase